MSAYCERLGEQEERHAIDLIVNEETRRFEAIFIAPYSLRGASMSIRRFIALDGIF